MASNWREPLNLGTEEMVSVDELVALICHVANKELTIRHDLSKPQGVRGRNSDNSRLRQVLGWEPPTRLREGLETTYKWIENELQKSGRYAPAVSPHQVECLQAV
jgi:nucleoside-diphosphate-sugar epimerase